MERNGPERDASLGSVSEVGFHSTPPSGTLRTPSSSGAVGRNGGIDQRCLFGCLVRPPCSSSSSDSDSDKDGGGPEGGPPDVDDMDEEEARLFREFMAQQRAGAR